MTQLLELSGDLQQKRGFADARLPPDEDHRAGHDSATEDEIELLDSRLEPPALRALDVAQPHGRRHASALGHRPLPGNATAGRGGRGASGHLFDERIPLTAGITTASPLGMIGATAGAAVYSFCS